MYNMCHISMKSPGKIFVFEWMYVRNYKICKGLLPEAIICTMVRAMYKNICEILSNLCYFGKANLVCVRR